MEINDERRETMESYMDTANQLNRIRQVSTASMKQQTVSAAWAILLGITLGVLAKLVDNPELNPVFDDIGSRLGIWVFAATLLAVFSYSPRMASVRIFAFFGSLLAVYYTYTVFILNFFPKMIIVFWSIIALISPFFAFIIWYAGGRGLLSLFLSALPITLLLTECYGLRNAYLPVHTHYYLIPWLQGIYLIMMIILLCVLVKGTRERLITAAMAVIFSIILVRLDLLGLIFGGTNTVL